MFQKKPGRDLPLVNVTTWQRIWSMIFDGALTDVVMEFGNPLTCRNIVQAMEQCVCDRSVEGKEVRRFGLRLHDCSLMNSVHVFAMLEALRRIRNAGSADMTHKPRPMCTPRRL